MGPSARRVLSRAAEAVPATVFTAVALALVLRPWAIPLSRPFLYVRDGISMAAGVKGMLTNGWYDHNPDLGFPFGQDHGDFPLGADNLHWLMMKGIGVFTQDAVLVTNVYFIVSFFLVTLSAFFCMRALGISVWAATAGATLFSFLPYHFMRGTHHLPLAAYWSVPIACGMLLALSGDRLPFVRRESGRIRVEGGRRAALFVAGGLILAAGNVYYAAFFLVLAVILATVRALSTRSVVPVLAAGAMGAVVLVGLVANLAPQLNYQRQHGRNDQTAVRTPGESDYYALRPIQLVAPTPGHRIEALDKITFETLKAPNNSEGTSYLGTVGTLGFLGLLAVALMSVAGGTGTAGRPDLLFRRLALPIIPALLVGVTGGFSWIIGLAGVTEFRAWNRISLFIAFFSLAAVAAGLDRVAHRFRSANRSAWLLPCLAGALVVIGVLDQTTKVIVPDSRTFAAEFDNDKAFVASIEAQLRPRDAVFQLPFLPYPEAEAERAPGVVDYDPFRGYLHSRTLRWSYGGMRGRESDWQISVVRQPPREFLQAITAVGFRGVWIDRAGYTDRGQFLESSVSEIVGSDITVSADGRFSFFPLAEFAEGEVARRTDREIGALRRQTLAAPAVRGARGFSEPQPGIGATQLVAQPEAALKVRNRTESPQRVRVRGRIIAPDGASGTLVLTSGKQRMQLSFGPASGTIDAPLLLAPGDQEIGFTFTRAAGADGRQWELEGLEVMPAPASS